MSVPTVECSAPAHGGREKKRAGYGRVMVGGLDQGATRAEDFPGRWPHAER